MTRTHEDVREDRLWWALAWALAAGIAAYAPRSHADEGGASFWAPGQFSSFAAVPSAPGFAFPLVYLHESADAGADKTFVRGGDLVAGIHADADLVFALPTYTFAQPVAGGQAAIGVGFAAGDMRVRVDATLASRNGASISGSRSDSKTGGSDLYPLATLKWNDGNSNWLAYGMAGLPVGAYQVGRLANIGLNHYSIDLGGGYTYLDAKKGRELSIVAGATYNFENKDTQYRNGIDGHIDWAASQFLSEQTHIGLVGYAYSQITGDSGSGATLGDNKSRIYGIGPQAGYFFPMRKEKAYVNLRGYYEFGARNRAEGWNVWLTVALPLF